MKKSTVLKLTICLICLNIGFTFAQKSPVNELLTSYVTYSNNLNDENSVVNITSLLHEKFEDNATFIGLAGFISRETKNLTGVTEDFTEKSKDNNYNFKMTINKVVYESQKDKAGTISAVVNFESMIDEKVTEKGTVLINMIASKFMGEWKIIQLNTVKISEQSEVGKCVSYLFSNGNAYFNSETYYPAGIKYKREFQSFRIGTSGGERAIINRGDSDKTFIWKLNGDVYNGKTFIGKAAEAKDAVQLVIQNAYSKTCTEFAFS